MTIHMSVAESLYTQIKIGILKGDFPPGTVLRQEDLAKKFEVSRVPLREAFSKLEAEGFLSLRPRRGYAVNSLNPEEISEIFDLRMLIEGHAGQIATKNQTPEDITDVERIVDRMEALDETDPGYFMQWLDLNRAFHERLIAACRRPRLLKMALQLRDIVEPYIRLETMMTGHAHEANIDHREIVNAFASGNVELVGALSTSHCGRTAARLLRSIREGSNSGNGKRAKPSQPGKEAGIQHVP